MTTISTTAALRKLFYRLTNSSETDDGLEEFDDSDNEAVDYFLQHGLWAAQEHIIDSGAKDRWVKVSSTISFSGADSTDGGRYTDLPSDFLRLAGEDDYSALRSPNGTRWGVLIHEEHRHDRRGNWYYLLNDRLWITRSATPPSDLVMDYHWRLPVLASLTFSDFPEAYRPLIAAEAAVIAMEEDWLPGGEEMQGKLLRNVDAWRKKAARGMRRTQQPRRVKSKPVHGSHWFS